MNHKVSVSKLNLLEECPRCFWLDVVKGIKRPSGMFSSLNNGMDLRIKEHFDNSRENEEMPPEIKELDGYKLFNDKEKLDVWRNNFNGLKLEHKGIILSGAIDEVLIKDGKLVPLDFKCRGFPCKEDSHKYYINQLKLYSLLLQISGCDVADHAFLLFYYPKEIKNTGLFAFETNLIKVDTNVADAVNLLDKTVKVLQSEEPPSPDEQCGFCKYLRTN